MPSCFQLIDKTTNKAISLNKIDQEICKEVLLVDVHPKYYGGDHFNWFDTIGFQIATGKHLGSQELRSHYLNSELWSEYAPVIEKILNYLELRYTSRSFYSR